MVILTNLGLRFHFKQDTSYFLKIVLSKVKKRLGYFIFLKQNQQIYIVKGGYNKNDIPNKLIIVKNQEHTGQSILDILAMISLFVLSFLLFMLRLSSGSKNGDTLALECYH